MNPDEKFALLFGILLGDGCLSLVDNRKKFITITGSLDDDLPFFKQVIFPLLKEFRGKNTPIKFRKDCRAIEFNFTDKRLFDKISSVGFPIGKKGANLSIPKIFYENNLIKYIVAGFFATDGSLVLTKNPNKFYPRIEGTSISKKIINQIVDYLTLKGMNGAFYLAKRRKLNSEYRIQPQYRFQFNGRNNLIIFNEKISFINLKHQKKFENFLVYSNLYDNKIKGVPTQLQKKDRLMTLRRI